MKRKLLLLTLLFPAINSFSQVSKFPNGVYLNIDQLKNMAPAFDANLQVIRRTQGDIGFNGGNDYEIKSDIDSLAKKYIKKKIFAYKKNDSLFLNCIHHSLSTWYAYCLTEGNFVTFSGAMSNSKTNEEVAPYGIMFGAIGGGIAGANAAKKRFFYVLSLRTGNVRLLKKEYITERLKEHEDLLNQFSVEQNQDSTFVLIKYINRLNEITPLNSAAPVQQQK